MRTALAAATALFSDLGDRRKQEYLEKIVLDALERGQEMKQKVSDVIKKVGFKVTEGRIRKIVYWGFIRYLIRLPKLRILILVIQLVKSC